MCNACLNYCSQPRIWSVPGIWYICMHVRFRGEWQVLVSILSAFTQCTQCTLLKILDVFSLGVDVQQSRAPTSITTVPPPQPVVPCALPDVSRPHGDNIVIYEMYCILISFMFLVVDFSLLFVSECYLKTSYLLLVKLLTAVLFLLHVMFLIPK